MLGMLEIEENLRTPKYFLGSGLMRNIYTRYHICYMRIKSRRVSLERWFDVKYLSCRYHRYCCLTSHNVYTWYLS